MRKPHTLGLVHFSFYCYFYCSSLVHWGQFIFLFIVISIVATSYTGASSFFFLLLFLLQQPRTLGLGHFFNVISTVAASYTGLVHFFYCYFYYSSLVHWGQFIFLFIVISTVTASHTGARAFFYFLFSNKERRGMGPKLPRTPIPTEMIYTAAVLTSRVWSYWSYCQSFLTFRVCLTVF